MRDDGTPARSMCNVAMTFPAIPLERLCAHHDRLHGILMAVDAVLLDDVPGMLIGPDHDRGLSRAEHKYIVCTLASLFEIVINDVVMGKVAIRTLRPGLVCAVIIVFVH